MPQNKKEAGSEAALRRVIAGLLLLILLLTCGVFLVLTSKKPGLGPAIDPLDGLILSGLAMDIVSAGYYTKYSDLVEAFETEKEAIWLKENCARFGFILRFPKDKTDITGINFEPWHFRYVGEDHAQAIMEQGICLEEDLGALD